MSPETLHAVAKWDMLATKAMQSSSSCERCRQGHPDKAQHWTECSLLTSLTITLQQLGRKGALAVCLAVRVPTKVSARHRENVLRSHQQDTTVT